MSMLRPFLALMFLNIAIHSYGQFKNQKIDEGTREPVGNPTVAINPKNPQNIVIASAPDHVYVSADGGVTWERKKTTSPMRVFSDPKVVADSKGNFYIIHLSDSSHRGNPRAMKQIFCHASGDGGKTWDDGNPIISIPTKDQHRPSATVDSKGNIYVTWTQYDAYGSPDSTCQSRILLSTSSNGKKWSKPVLISQGPGNCVDAGSAAGGMAAVSEDRKMFVSWSNQNKLFIDRSFDNGYLWLSNDIVIGPQPGGWSILVPGHKRANGLPVLAVDKFKGGHQGMLYMSWADQRNGVDDTDIWFVRSANFGDNWTSAMKVNDDPKGKHQYLPCMTIDQSTGYLYILYYDRRNYDNHQTDVYLAYSTDSGNTFKNVRVSETPFELNGQWDLGDNLHITAHKGLIVPVWGRVDDGVTSVWTAIIRQDELIKPLNTPKK